MDQRIARAVAAAAVLTLPLLAGCGTPGAGSESEPVAPVGQSPAPGSDDAVPTTTPSTTPTPSVDPAKETERVEAATEKFVRTVLTVGYPDKTFGAYTERIEPLMTEDGFSTLETPESIKKGAAALKSLYPQRARSAPKFASEAKVTSIDGTTATAQLAYENLAQQKSGSDWKTLKSLGKGSVTVRLVLDDGKWLVDNAAT